MGRKRELQIGDRQFYNESIDSLGAFNPLTLSTMRDAGRAVVSYWVNSAGHGGSYYRNKNPNTAASKARLEADKVADSIMDQYDDLRHIATGLAVSIGQVAEAKQLTEQQERVDVAWQTLRPSTEELLYLLYGQDVEPTGRLLRSLSAGFLYRLKVSGPNDEAIIKEAVELGIDPESLPIVYPILV